jgi:hypothetical protein
MPQIPPPGSGSGAQLSFFLGCSLPLSSKGAASVSVCRQLPGLGVAARGAFCWLLHPQKTAGDPRRRRRRSTFTGTHRVSQTRRVAGLVEIYTRRRVWRPVAGRRVRGGYGGAKPASKPDGCHPYSEQVDADYCFGKVKASRLN